MANKKRNNIRKRAKKTKILVKKSKATKNKKPSPKIVTPKLKSGFSTNNFNYIRALLWKKYRSDFKSYFDSDFIRKVNLVYYECKSLGGDCSDDTIIQIFDDVRFDDRRAYPFIDEDLYESEHLFFEINQIEFDLFPSYLWIISPMIMNSPSEFIVPNYYYNYVKLVNDIENNISKFINEVKNTSTFSKLNEKESRDFLRLANKEPLSKTERVKFAEFYAKWKGENERGYKKYFSEWVDWCNQVTRRSLGSSHNSDEVQIHFKFTKPEYNESNKRWETTIFICTPSGQINSFGYTPSGLSYDHDIESEYIQPTEEELTKPPTIDEKELQKKALDRINKLSEFRLLIKDFKNKVRELKIKQQEEDLNKRILAQKMKMKKAREKKKKEKWALEKKMLAKELKNAELKRLKSIKRELEKSIKLYKEIKDRVRMKKALVDLDRVMNKIKKIS